MNKLIKLSLVFLLSVFSFSLQGEEAASAEVSDELKLYIAAKEGRLSQVKAMVASGIDVNAKNKLGRTALMGAAYFGNKGIVETLVVEGVDVNQVDEQGKTALMLAVANQRVEVVEVLIFAGADVKIEDKNKNTALKMAEKLKNKKLTKLLESASE